MPRPMPPSSPGQLGLPNVKDRVKQLESQVELLMGALSQASPGNTTLSGSTHHSEAQLQSVNGHDEMDATFEAPILGPDAVGYIELSQNHTSYVGSTHWLAIMRNIPELVDVFNNSCYSHDHQADVLLQDDDDEPSLATWSEKATRQEILAAIPTKEFADSLVAVCFMNTNNEAMIVHPPTFRKEYDRFWANPDTASIMWIGMLFALMCLAVQYQRFSPDEAKRLQVMDADPDRLIWLYRKTTIQCLVLGKYSRAPPFAVETLLLYVFIEYLRSQSIPHLDGPWIQWGSLVRVAFKAGYHRDGSHFPEISCFQAELRRRVWALLIGWDAYLSNQSGLPRMVGLSLCDTAEPRNLYDEDLYEHMVDLPLPRPEHAQTFPGFHVAKNRLLDVFARITELTMCCGSSPLHSEVLKLDKLLTTTYDSILPIWKPRPPPPMSNGSQPATPISVPCIFLTFIYYRAQVVLHRPYIFTGRQHKQHFYSRKVAIEAALNVLKHQWDLYLETAVGGQLCRHGWKFLILLVQDFLFATAILCGELAEEISLATHVQSENSRSHSDVGRCGADELRDRVFNGLSSSYIVWLQSNDSGSAREVKLVVTSLQHLLRRAQEVGIGQTATGTSTQYTPGQISSSNTEPGSSKTTSPEGRLGVANGPPQTDGIYFGLGHFPI